MTGFGLLYYSAFVEEEAYANCSGEPCEQKTANYFGVSSMNSSTDHVFLGKDWIHNLLRALLSHCAVARSSRQLHRDKGGFCKDFTHVRSCGAETLLWIRNVVIRHQGPDMDNGGYEHCRNIFPFHECSGYLSF